MSCPVKNRTLKIRDQRDPWEGPLPGRASFPFGSPSPHCRSHRRLLPRAGFFFQVLGLFWRPCFFSFIWALSVLYSCKLIGIAAQSFSHHLFPCDPVTDCFFLPQLCSSSSFDEDLRSSCTPRGTFPLTLFPFFCRDFSVWFFPRMAPFLYNFDLLCWFLDSGNPFLYERIPV